MYNSRLIAQACKHTWLLWSPHHMCDHIIFFISDQLVALLEYDNDIKFLVLGVW